MNIKLFIAGTDTEIGKTYASVQLLKNFKKNGLSTLGLKPVASGGIWQNGQFYNQDTLQLQEAATIKLDHDVLTPFVFEPPVAPHLAAKHLGKNLTVEQLNNRLKPALAYPADICLIEGFGGWYAPLNHVENMADFVSYHQFKVILVVGIRLGCINHSILTYKAIQNSGVNIVGWIANCIDPQMLYKEENIASLLEWLPIPCLGVIHFGQEAEFDYQNYSILINK